MTLLRSTQANDTKVTDKVKSFIGKSDMRIRKEEGKSLDIFSRLKDFV
jgi:hypothetical protein